MGVWRKVGLRGRVGSILLLIFDNERVTLAPPGRVMLPILSVTRTTLRGAFSYIFAVLISNSLGTFSTTTTTPDVVTIKG